MFTGIVREVGRVREIAEAGDRRVVIGCARPADEIELGASISCSGVCLTVVDKGTDAEGDWFAVTVSGETAARTTLGGWAVGSPINLEPALRLGDELGGHIVSGHVDGVAEVVSVTPEGDSHRIEVAAPAGFGRYLAPKGSVALDGISLTVNEVADEGGATRFGVNIIPHTWTATTLAGAAAGTTLNFEVDLLARYVDRLTRAG